MMKRGLWFALALIVGSAGCMDEQTRDEDESASRVDATGTIAMNLVGSDSQGRQYRLRNAEFVVGSAYYPGFDGGASSPTATLSTETNPDADYLSVRVVPGPYSVTLQGSWSIERLTPQGPERVTQVVLLSDARQQTWVYQNGVSEVFFRFGVDGDLIDFRHGDIRVGIEIELPDGGGADGGTDGGLDGGVGVDMDAGASDGGIDAGSISGDAGAADAGDAATEDASALPPDGAIPVVGDGDDGITP